MVDNNYIVRNQEAYNKIIGYDIKFDDLNRLTNNTQLMNQLVYFNRMIFSRFLTPKYFNYSSVLNTKIIESSEGNIPNENNAKRVDYNISYWSEIRNLQVGEGGRSSRINWTLRKDRDRRIMLEKGLSNRGGNKPWFIVEKDPNANIINMNSNMNKNSNMNSNTNKNNSNSNSASGASGNSDSDSDSASSASGVSINTINSINSIGNNSNIDEEERYGMMYNTFRNNLDDANDVNFQRYDIHNITNYITSKEGITLPFSIQQDKKAKRYYHYNIFEDINDPHVNLIDPALIYILYHHNLLDICIDIIDNVQDIQLRKLLYGLAKFSINDKQDRNIIHPTFSNYIYSTKTEILENRDIPPGFILITFQRPMKASYLIHEDIYFMIGHRVD